MLIICNYNHIRKKLIVNYNIKPTNNNNNNIYQIIRKTHTNNTFAVKVGIQYDDRRLVTIDA